MPNNNMLRYRQNQAATSPEKTVLMLFDGAIRFLTSAMNEVEVNENIPEKSRLIEKTVKIIEYLQSCLDQEKGGEIALNLNKLYDYMSIKLTEANLKNDLEKMDEVLNLLSTIREGWNGICNNNSANINSINAAANNAFSQTGAGAGVAAGASMEKKVGIKA